MKAKLIIPLIGFAFATHIYGAATDDHGDIKAEIAKRHDEAVKRPRAG
jgi:hypothetical protein